MGKRATPTEEETVKDKKAKTPFDEAGKMVYQKAFRKGVI